MNELACIEAFVTIVDYGSQLEAAKRLHQTGAAINKKLAKLEEKLGVLLLDRDNKTSKLTPIGERYYHAYKELLEKLEETHQIAKLDKARPKGRLMISVNRAIANNWIVPHVKAFLKRYPDINLVFDIAEKPSDYVPGKQDILIASDFIRHENLVRKNCFITRDVLCASPQYLKQQGEPKKLSDLHQLHYIGLCARSPLNTIQLSDNKSLEINQPYIRINDDQTTIELALKHLGFIFIKEYEVSNELQSGKLIEILPKLNKTKAHIAIYYHYQQYLDPKIRVFVDYFSEKFVRTSQ